MLHALDRIDHELSVVLVDDETIRELNRTYRARDVSTDVLSFAMAEGEFGDVNPSVLGDVVISVPMARRQASRAQRDPFDEVTTLLAHGVLHLLGWDHQTEERDREMREETRRLVRVSKGERPITSRR
jgi:probable rRNA maturation factor